MKKVIGKFLSIFGLFVVLFAAMRMVFIAVYANEIGVGSVGDFFAPLWHGLSMDMSVAGYLTAVPMLLAICRTAHGGRWVGVAESAYFGLAATIVSAIFWLDLVLYGYWGFRLDATPFFYFSTSPSAAMASAEWWHWIARPIGLIGLAVGIWLILRRTAGRIDIEPARNWRTPTVAVLLTALLFLPIRGGVTVSTMNPSRAYFSPKQGLNHAATNPIFNLLYSATHQNDYATRYRFMADDEALAMFLNNCTEVTMPDTVAPLLTTDRPDIVLVILESFSAHLMPSLGGSPVAIGLDSIACEGMLFTNFYASSFRTDRALTAILSALPGQPSTSVLKYPDKIERLPSLPEVLARKGGYDLNYYYGGDTNFTNMQAYLVSMGFDKVVCDKDFSIAEKASKWGAPDHLVFSRALADITAAASDRPQLSVIQTSSSHEPFEVPYSNPRFADNDRCNAFAYTDSCLTDFIGRLKQSPRWNNTLVVIVPDHFGCWPQGLEDVAERHHIPLVFSGGALARRGEKVDVLGTQTDLTCTLLAALGIDYATENFLFSRNLLSGGVMPLTAVTNADEITILTDNGQKTFNCTQLEEDARTLQPSEASSDELAAMYYLQTIYHYIDKL